jgi:hypothetical protein
VSGDGTKIRTALTNMNTIITYDYSMPVTAELDNFFSGASGSTARDAVRNANSVLAQNTEAVDYFANIMKNVADTSTARSSLQNAYDILQSTSSSYFTTILNSVDDVTARTALTNAKAILNAGFTLGDLLSDNPSNLNVKNALIRSKVVIDYGSSYFSDIMVATNSGITISGVSTDYGARRSLLKSFVNANTAGDLSSLLDISGTALTGSAARTALNWYETTVSGAFNSAMFTALRTKGLDATYTVGLFQGFTSSDMRSLVDTLRTTPYSLSASDINSIGSITWGSIGSTVSNRAIYIYGAVPQ